MLASIGSRVQLFKWAARDGAPELVVEGGYGGFVTALYVKHIGDSILVGESAVPFLLHLQNVFGILTISEVNPAVCPRRNV